MLTILVAMLTKLFWHGYSLVDYYGIILEDGKAEDE